MHYIENLIHEGEHQQLDFKFRVDDARKIAKTMVAFANTDGGRLLIGVKDNGSIVGVRSDEEYHMIEAASQLYTKPEVAFKAIAHEIHGKQVLEIIIEPSPIRPHYAVDNEGKSWAYFRKADQNHPANGVIIDFWKKRHDPNTTSKLEKYDKSLSVVHHLLDMNERVTISKVVKEAGITATEARDLLSTLLHWNSIHYEIDQKGIYFTKA